jgi:hypothetical protein
MPTLPLLDIDRPISCQDIVDDEREDVNPTIRGWDSNRIDEKSGVAAAVDDDVDLLLIRLLPSPTTIKLFVNVSDDDADDDTSMK